MQLRGVLLALVTISLVGCSAILDLVPPGTFSEVEQAREDLQLDLAGEMQAENEWGGNLGSEEGPVYKAVIAGANAYSTIEVRLVELGYTQTGSLGLQTFWDSVSTTASDTVIQVTLEEVDAGDEVGVGDKEIFVVKDAGAAIKIRG